MNNNQNDSRQQPYQGPVQLTPQGHSLCRWVWKFLSCIGATLTFIRNFISNLVMLLVIGLIILAVNLAGTIKEEAEGMFSGTTQVSELTQVKRPVLYVPLRGSIEEKPFGSSQFDNLRREFDAGINGRITTELIGLEKALQDAASDDRIEYVLFDLEDMGPVSMPVAERIGAKIDALNQAGKKTAAMAVTFSQGAYAIAAHTQHIYLDPMGSVDLKGISLSSLYFRELLQNLEITPYIFRAGKFKSAVEPFTSDGMSSAVKAEYQEVADSLWRNYEDSLSVRKSISRMEILPPAGDFVLALQNYEGNLPLLQLESNLADELKSSQEVLQELSHEYGADPDNYSLPAMLSLSEYQAITARRMLRNGQAAAAADDADSEGTIAVVYGTGEISNDSRDAGNFAPDNLIPVLDDIKDDHKVKAVVLYINSPGGMALASEQIRRKVQDLRDSGLKVVVSIQGMGASGAYWVSTASDKILAAPGSIVGSVGVFAVAFGADRLLNDFGVYQDGVSTHEFARTPVAEPMSDNVQQVQALSVQHTYKTFVDLVAKSRHLDPANYESFAEGRIFTADKAQKIGLIDAVGTLDDAVAEAAKLAGLDPDKVKVEHRTLPADPRMSFLESFLFSSAAKLLPQDVTGLLLKVYDSRIKALSGDNSALNRENLYMVSVLTEPEL